MSSVNSAMGAPVWCAHATARASSPSNERRLATPVSGSAYAWLSSTSRRRSFRFLSDPTTIVVSAIATVSDAQSETACCGPRIGNTTTALAAETSMMVRQLTNRLRKLAA